MESTITILVSAVVSGIFATIITLWWQNKSEKKQLRRSIFCTLMAFRFKISCEECVKAINSVQVIFYNEANVQNAWTDFKYEADKPSDSSRIFDAYIKLLEEVGKACGFSEIKWNEIKNYYYPQGLSDELNESDRLRKANLRMMENALINQSSVNN